MLFVVALLAGVQILAATLIAVLVVWSVFVGESTVSTLGAVPVMALWALGMAWCWRQAIRRHRRGLSLVSWDDTPASAPSPDESQWPKHPIPPAQWWAMHEGIGPFEGGPLDQGRNRRNR